mmetsp:Transcript_39029/g.34707  ORF Transcript_39029/g.34707 Transcript_39029/m.34707 type:complete len:317 (+) Transcript_39029:269-1219(+)
MLPVPSDPGMSSPNTHAKKKRYSFSHAVSAYHEEEKKALKPVKLIAKSRYPIYLVHSAHHERHLAMKVFPHEADGGIAKSFLSELRFSSLSHPNIVNVYEARSEKVCKIKGEHQKVSYILMEVAPYGDFVKHLTSYNIPKDEKLSRTFFHQLVSGIEYMHAQNMAHLDLKLENLLLGDNFILKIADFDFGVRESEKLILGKGSRNYRAPEVKNKTVKNYKAGDIYSMGIILFSFLLRGLPYNEDKEVKNVNLMDLLLHDINEFWNHYEKLDADAFDASPAFRELFEAMVKENPEDRISLKQIRESKWFKGPVYTQK